MKEQTTIGPMIFEDIKILAENFCFPWTTIEATTILWENSYKEHQAGIRTVMVIEQQRLLLG